MCGSEEDKDLENDRDSEAGSGEKTQTQRHQNEPFAPGPLKSPKDTEADGVTVLVFPDFEEGFNDEGREPPSFQVDDNSTVRPTPSKTEEAYDPALDHYASLVQAQAS